MKQNFTFLFLLFVMTVFGQKTVNDSIEKKEYDKYNLRIVKKTQLPDLLKTKEDFYFRLSFEGTEIDIWKDSTNNINGILTKFIFSKEDKTNKNDTIFKKYKLENSYEIYNLINESKILDIPSEKEIKNWSNGHDGITYTFEFANKYNYQIKSYWTPSAQDSTITEAKSLVKFCEEINVLAKYYSTNESFERELPLGFKYENGSIWVLSKPKISNSYVYFDYNGNYKLPLGFTFGYYVNKIKKKKFNLGIRINLQNNFSDNLHFENIIWKRKIFGNDNNYYDSFRLIYEYSKLDYVKTFPKFENYKINYAGTIDKFFSFDLGYNQLKTEKTFDGISLELSKRFKSINLEPYYNINIFENRITNYKVGMRKSIPIKMGNRNFRISTNLFYEKTFDFKSLNFSLYVPIKEWTIN